ncbi:MAG: esterase-like activity of phytase family protein [Geminicoccaceae bacterium]|nr:esterase-like activity of phytase family protein [Geminicoccaceae bacterium]
MERKVDDMVPGSLGAPLALLILTLAALLSGCAVAGAAGQAPKLRLEPVQLNPHRPDRVDVDRLHFEAGFQLRLADERFGGLSGVWLSDDGKRMVAASDGGTLFELALEHDQQGRLAGVGIVRAVVPGRMDDDPGFRLDQNVEALARLLNPDELVMAYEGTHRLRAVPMDDLEAIPTALPVPGVLAEHGNSGMEGLTSLPDGRLLALIEKGDKRRDAWIIDADGAVPLDYVQEFGFETTGADRLGDEIWVLERRFSWVGGFQSRIVRLDAGAIRPGAKVEGEEIARLRPPLTTENFEAIAVHRDERGRTLVYLLSDDNFNLLQRTMIMQFSLIDGPSESR